MEGDQAVAIAFVEPTWTQYHIAYRVGTRHELSRSAAGKAILREGRPGAVRTNGELQPGACGSPRRVRQAEVGGDPRLGTSTGDAARIAGSCAQAKGH